MAYLVRDKDKAHFVTPSYREVLAVSQQAQVKKNILELSERYGDNITLQKTTADKYEVTFSPDKGYLLGESVWQYLKSPPDLIYCEALPEPGQVLLVIVKNGSVHLDGSFPVESIADELVIFVTEQNQFEIYTYGEVPLSEVPEEGKFSFDLTSVKSFQHLDASAFEKLPKLDEYLLKPVQQVLIAQGIGVIPLKPIILIIVFIGVLWLAWSYLSQPKEAVKETPQQVNPYDAYNTALATPQPTEAVGAFLQALQILTAPPAWSAGSITYANGLVTTTATSQGGKIQTLMDWGKAEDISVAINGNTVILTKALTLKSRPLPQYIYPIDQVLTELIDNLTTFIDSSGNTLQVGNPIHKSNYTQVTITIGFGNMSPAVLALLANQFDDLPIALQLINVTLTNGNMTGSMVLNVFGS